MAFGAGLVRRGLLFWCAANVLAEALIYFSAEKGVGVRIWLLMLLLRHPAEERSMSFSNIGTLSSNCTSWVVDSYQAATSHIGSAPRLAEDVVSLMPVFPPGTPREGASSVPTSHIGVGTLSCWSMCGRRIFAGRKRPC